MRLVHHEELVLVMHPRFNAKIYSAEQLLATISLGELGPPSSRFVLPLKG